MPKKPPGRRIPSDDYTVVVDGEVYHPHEGETVWFTTFVSPRLFKSIQKFRELAVKENAIDSEDPQERASQLAVLQDQAYDELCGMLAQHVLRWDWTNEFGEPLPQPGGDPERIRALDALEINYLMSTVTRGEARASEKLALNGSLTTSSDTEPTPMDSPISTTAHSHTRA